jgi:hypothetical protein
VLVGTCLRSRLTSPRLSGKGRSRGDRRTAGERASPASPRDARSCFQAEPVARVCARSAARFAAIGQPATRKHAFLRTSIRRGDTQRGWPPEPAISRIEQRMTSPDGRPPSLRLRPSGAAGKTECRSVVSRPPQDARAAETNPRPRSPAGTHHPRKRQCAEFAARPAAPCLR